MPEMLSEYIKALPLIEKKQILTNEIIDIFNNFINREKGPFPLPNANLLATRYGISIEDTEDCIEKAKNDLIMKIQSQWKISRAELLYELSLNNLVGTKTSEVIEKVKPTNDLEQLSEEKKAFDTLIRFIREARVGI